MITLENTHRKDGDEDIYVLTIDGKTSTVPLSEALKIITEVENENNGHT